MQLNKKQIIFISTLLFFSLFSFDIFSQTKKDALKLYRNGDYAEAIKVCQEEITEKPNNMDSYAVLCWSLVKNKQYSEAELWAIKGREISSYDQR
ncbi:MAG: tetratricopeptide repeat protein, partial [Spirochaetaceae bacterium]|nr:tetratricopeptide repeat protein [Spirochaetaceae bacterium]